jgi:hypothetical protein
VRGCSLEEIGDFVGHSSTYMVDRYRHLLDGQRERAAERLDVFLGLSVAATGCSSITVRIAKRPRLNLQNRGLQVRVLPPCLAVESPARSAGHDDFRRHHLSPEPQGAAPAVSVAAAHRVT